MGQVASDPIGSARQLKDQDLTALWKSQVGPDGRLADSLSNVKDSDGRSALHIAAAEGKQNAVALLLKSSSISANAVDNNIITPLHSAVFSISGTPHDILTYLGIFACRNHAEVALALIQHGSDVNAQDHQGLTALHWSAINGSLDCIQVLLANGADLSIRNLKGQTAMDIANSLKPRLRAAVVAKLNGQHSGMAPLMLPSHVPTDSAAHKNELARQMLFSALLDGVGKDVRRMLALCQLWGTVKCTHPFLAYRVIKWDHDLMEALEICSSSTADNKQFLTSIIQITNKLCDPNTRVMYGNKLLTLDIVRGDSPISNVPASSSASTAPSLALPLHLSSSTTSSTTSSGGNVEYPKVTMTEDKLGFVDFSEASSCHLSSVEPLVQTFASLDANCQGIVFDVRCLSSDGHKVRFPANFGIFFQEAFRTFLPAGVVLPITRQRMYQGLPEHVKLSTTGPNLFEHGFLVSDAVLLTPLHASTIPPKRHPFSFIIDKNTPLEIINLAVALQSRAQAYIVMQAEFDDVLTVGNHKLVWEPGIQTTDFRLSDIVEGTNKSVYGDIVVQIRQNERFNPDGSVGLRADQLMIVSNGTIAMRETHVLEAYPSLTITASKDANGHLKIASKLAFNRSQDAAIEAAVLYCYGQKATVEVVRQLPFPVRIVELEFKEPELPDKKGRLLALFRLWNAVRFFYPYKHLLQFPWEFAFLKSITSFKEADSAVKYSLAIAETVALLLDAHAYVRSPHLGYLIGTHVPSVRVKQIGQATVITHVAALAGDAISKDSHSHRLPPLIALATGSSPSQQAPLATPPLSDPTTSSSSAGANAATSSSNVGSENLTPRGTNSLIVVKIPSKDAHHHTVEQLGGAKDDTGSPPVLQLGVQVGDILVAVDGTPVEQRRDFLASLFSLSSPQAKKWRTDLKLLAGPEGSLAKLTLKRLVSRVLEVESANPHVPQYVEYTLDVPRTVVTQMAMPKTGPVYHVLEVCDASQRKIAYLDLTRLAVPDVDAALQHLLVPTVGAIVMDLRGHTRGTIFRLAPHFATHVTRVASTQVPVLLPSLLVGDVHESMQLRGQQHCVPAIPASASQSPQATLIQSIKIVALINEETMSHGEYAATVLKAVRPDTIFFGSRSTGSLGSVTNIPLPGGILVGFTAMGITKPDGSEIQSHGITPDHIVQELPESVLIGRDDIMEAALTFLKNCS